MVLWHPKSRKKVKFSDTENNIHTKGHNKMVEKIKKTNIEKYCTKKRTYRKYVVKFHD